MVKYSLPKVPRHELTLELKRLVREGLSHKLSKDEALKRAMRIMNKSFNVPSHSEQSAPWVKPAGFDEKWWVGEWLPLRLGIRETKRERRRAAERRRRFEALVRASERRKLLSLRRAGRHFRFTRRLDFEDSPSPDETANFNPQSEVVFSPFPDKVEQEMHQKFVEATDLARSMLFRGACDSLRGASEAESCSNDDVSELSARLEKAWDLPKECDTTVVEVCSV